MKYYRITAAEHMGTIMRANGRLHEQYVPKQGWQPSALLLLYFHSDDLRDSMFEEISEAQADVHIRALESNSAQAGLKSASSVQPAAASKPVRKPRVDRRSSVSARTAMHNTAKAACAARGVIRYREADSRKGRYAMRSDGTLKESEKDPGQRRVREEGFTAALAKR